MRFTLITYSLLAAVTPVLVLLSSGLIAAPPDSLQPLQSMSFAETLMDSEPKTLVRAAGQIAIAAAPAAPASIVEENGQLFLEFYHPLNAAAQTPSLVLILDSDVEPHQDFGQPSDRQLTIGQLAKQSGQHRYLLPTAVDVDRYLSVVIWCPELKTIMGYMPISSQV
ncbi:MAG: DM13 domain-containing protein [Cyanobacteria bacterium J06607_6]